MNNSNDSSAAVREMVAHFPDSAAFDAAVADLRKAGFAKADLSVLATHESLSVADGSGPTLRDTLVAVLGEWKVEVPLVASGAILLAGGPAVAAVAAVIGAAVGGVAISDVVQEMTAQSHSERFAQAVAAGNIVLWVRCADPQREAIARDILVRSGGSDVHVNESVGRKD